MSKKRYTLYISRPLARRFDEVSLKSHGGKSALVEEALSASLRLPKAPEADDQIVVRLDDLARASKTIERDVAIVTETLALFVRYFLTITPPLPLDEQEPARLLGHERFQVFVAQIGKQLAGDQRLVTEVLETIVVQKPDLFAVAGVDAPPKPRTATIEQFVPRPNGRTEDGDTDHD
jgi:predicted transcriptional regulator